MKRVLALVACSGCALFASANAAHSHISPCVDNPAYGVVDVFIGAGTGVALVATEVISHQPWWALLPGAFLTSGIVGVISAERCRKSTEPKPSPPIDYPPPPETYAAPAPPPPDAALDEAEPAALPVPRGPDLRVDSDWAEKHPPADAAVD